MTDEAKSVLHQYLRSAREALVWKLEGLSDFDVRRPMTPTGTNLLGLVKHAAYVEAGYFGVCFNRPFPEPMPAWEDPDPNADMFASGEESRDGVVELYQRVAAHADATIEALDLEQAGQVPWWPDGNNDADLHTLLVHVIAELNRHAGHADIVRETIDGSAGLRANRSNLPDHDGAAWAAHKERLDDIAAGFRTA